ncbi:hypothetical protein BTJ40_03425 [Microbulbifer sp. A4B17]|uniref:hypothetical protein n=1 Tax=Microbulbifer sp. A4B17 TaxID=359370 RepID=UPI000D52B049|nr:hypothetical protein [Microbulbifer sp. A4B17]AWF79943.1 hypothetical protein BTJ40_03425 [Microbulbifer sp. A4B17]
MANTLIKKSPELLFLTYLLCIPNAASETISIQVSADNGSTIHTKQALKENALSDGNEAIYIKMAPNQFQAIKCEGPWGAIKYKKPMIEGPGFKLYQNDQQLIIQVIEHRVISADIVINSMDIQCIDTEPKQTINSIAEIVIERSISSEETLVFDNGYKLSYQYFIIEKDNKN